MSSQPSTKREFHCCVARRGFSPRLLVRAPCRRRDARLLSAAVTDVRILLGTRPFVPFTIVTSGGSRYPVPAPNHGGVDPQSSRVVVWLDDGSGIMIPGLHISSIEQEKLAP
jgi:hypothetical protein